MNSISSRVRVNQLPTDNNQQLSLSRPPISVRCSRTINVSSPFPIRLNSIFPRSMFSHFPSISISLFSTYNQMINTLFLITLRMFSVRLAYRSPRIPPQCAPMNLSDSHTPDPNPNHSSDPFAVILHLHTHRFFNYVFVTANSVKLSSNKRVSNKLQMFIVFCQSIIRQLTGILHALF